KTKLWKGSGTAEDPYQISCPLGLALLADSVNSHNKTYEDEHFVLANDIDLSGKDWVPIGIYTSSSDSQNDRFFRGVFDGRDKCIDGLSFCSPKNMLINKTESMGFFGCISSGACIKNLHIRSGNIIASTYQTGVITGAVLLSPNKKGTISIENCSNYADVFTSTHKAFLIGGIVGIVTRGSKANSENSEYPDVEIKNCHNFGNFTINVTDRIVKRNVVEKRAYRVKPIELTEYYIAGIIGVARGKTSVSICVNNGNIRVYGDHLTPCNLGGIIGCISDSITVSSCRNDGEINGGRLAGGIAACARSCFFTIEDCDNHGALSASRCSGGILGEMDLYNWNPNINISVKNSHNNTDLSGDHSGGIIGMINQEIAKTKQSIFLSVDSCTSWGNITGLSSSGGIVGIIELGANSRKTINVTNSVNHGALKGKVSGGIISTIKYTYHTYISWDLPATSFITISSCLNRGKLTGERRHAKIYDRRQPDFSVSGGIVGLIDEELTCFVTDTSFLSIDLHNCSNSGDIHASDYIGGIIGYRRQVYDKTRHVSKTRVQHCFNSGNLYGAPVSCTGGILGCYQADYPNKEQYIDSNHSANHDLILYRCFNTGTLSNGFEIGGVAGSIDIKPLPVFRKTIFEECFNTGNIRSAEMYANTGTIIGTIIDESSFELKRCYNHNSIQNLNSHGLAGLFIGASPPRSSFIPTYFDECYSFEYNSFFDNNEYNINYPHPSDISAPLFSIVAASCDPIPKRVDANPYLIINEVEYPTYTAFTIFPNNLIYLPVENRITLLPLDFYSSYPYDSLHWDFDTTWTIRPDSVNMPYFQWQSHPAAVVERKGEKVTLNLYAPCDSIRYYSADDTIAGTLYPTSGKRFNKGDHTFRIPGLKKTDTLFFVTYSEEFFAPSIPARSEGEY
ncbi:hypothetical protein LJC37_05040, partial [Bacteroidales bacterium OttesenSCG-928-E04]|nr:hypothetical protein [Bacteroidales bacterium OttesenSCG-928-E04]